MKSDLITIIKKEFARFFGDKRMVMSAVLPGILIYVLYSFMGSGMSEMYTTDDDYVFDVSVVNLPQSLEFLNELDETDRRLIENYYIKKMKVKEIASLYNLSESSVKVKLFRARKTIIYLSKKELEKFS